MAIITFAKFRFNRLMLTLIFGIRASDPSLQPGERLKRPGLLSHMMGKCKSNAFLDLMSMFWKVWKKLFALQECHSVCIIILVRRNQSNKISVGIVMDEFWG